MIPQLANHVEAGHLRHVDVEQDQRGLVLVRAGDRFASGKGEPHGVALMAQDRSQDFRGITIVVDH